MVALHPQRSELSSAAPHSISVVSTGGSSEGRGSGQIVISRKIFVGAGECEVTGEYDEITLSNVTLYRRPPNLEMLKIHIGRLQIRLNGMK